MAYGINKEELIQWKKAVLRGEVAFLTHYWLDDRFPNVRSVTKVGCSNVETLLNWGSKHGLKGEWIHYRKDGFPHFDLMGDIQKEILHEEGLSEHIQRFMEHE
ncbi:hypothetical protein [Rossellomorea aquimaris]|uniref:hypothetical protein n=1 Tax=Rossellomorea aquimaris TaxID=189382 RepID=UPI0007D06C8C|nr:hypothetical protein [Rossellomorea aquimaris]